jgi:pimeloyl-ACP methyl ester carboxylesterase
MPMIEYDGLRIDYVEAGQGAPVILVHSSVSGNRQWRRLIERLSGRYRVIAPNLRGYGGSTAWPPGRSQTLVDAAQVVLSLCDALALHQPIRLVGHSFGGAVALWAAQVLRERVSHLALYEPMLPGLLKAHGRLEAANETRELHADVKRLSSAGDWMTLGRRFTDYFNGDGSWDDSPAERQQAIADLLPPNEHEWDACMRPMRADIFGGVTAKGLLMRGRKSRAALIEIAAVLHQRFRHWRLVDMAGCGHMAPLAQAEVVNRWVADFLDRDGASQVRRENAGRPQLVMAAA